MAPPRMVLGLALLAGLALTTFADTGAGAAPVGQQTVTVRMIANPDRFEPRDITVAPGTTVTWLSVSGEHTSTSDTGLWESRTEERRDIPPGQSFSYTFTEPGVYPYYCRPHRSQGMVGSVTVSTAGKGAMSGTVLATQ
jgi:plastocyanin